MLIPTDKEHRRIHRGPIAPERMPLGQNVAPKIDPAVLQQLGEASGRPDINDLLAQNKSGPSRMNQQPDTNESSESNERNEQTDDNQIVDRDDDGLDDRTEDPDSGTTDQRAIFETKTDEGTMLSNKIANYTAAAVSVPALLAAYNLGMGPFGLMALSTAAGAGIGKLSTNDGIGVGKGALLGMAAPLALSPASFATVGNMFNAALPAMAQFPVLPGAVLGGALGGMFAGKRGATAGVIGGGVLGGLSMFETVAATGFNLPHLVSVVSPFNTAIAGGALGALAGKWAFNNPILGGVVGTGAGILIPTAAVSSASTALVGAGLLPLIGGVGVGAGLAAGGVKLLDKIDASLWGSEFKFFQNAWQPQSIPGRFATGMFDSLGGAVRSVSGLGYKLHEWAGWEPMKKEGNGLKQFAKGFFGYASAIPGIAYNGIAKNLIHRPANAVVRRGVDTVDEAYTGAIDTVKGVWERGVGYPKRTFKWLFSQNKDAHKDVQFTHENPLKKVAMTPVRTAQTAVAGKPTKAPEPTPPRPSRSQFADGASAPATDSKEMAA